MRITRIEIAGFKSFRERTGVILEEGITAIVGPNGCGKSNIIDAVRWALGEQRASALRGGKMTDVIFNGSAAARPVGLAEVKLTFSVGDAELPAPWDREDEIVVCRRLHRSGDSEYLINNETARLKDIQGLFLGTGAGTSTYSIIAQGTVDFIVTARPSERRELIEEAAGISRYKLQRRTTERNLDQTAQNLARVEDLVGEIARQVNSLRQQAARAERYHTLVAEERRMGLLGWLGERRRLAELMEAAEEAQDEARERIAEDEAVRLERVAAVEDARVYVELARRRYDEAVEKALRAEGRRDLLRGSVEQHTAEIARLERSVHRAGQRREELTARLEAARAETERIGEDLSRAGDELPPTEHIDALEARRTEQRERLTELTAQLDAVRTQHRELERTAARLTERRAGLSSSIAHLRQRSETATQERELQARKLDEARSLANTAQARLESALMSSEDADARVAVEREELARVVATAKEAAATARARREAAIRLETRLETLAASAPRPARGASGKGPAVDPAVEAALVPLGRLLQVTPAREATLAALLDGDLDALVLDATELDVDAVRTLSARQGGRVLVLAEPHGGLDDDRSPLPLDIEVAADASSAGRRLAALVRTWLRGRLSGAGEVEDVFDVWPPQRDGAARADAEGWLSDTWGSVRRTTPGGGLAVLRHSRDMRQVQAELETAREAVTLAERDHERAAAVADDVSARVEAAAEEANRLRSVAMAARAEAREASLRAEAVEGRLATATRDATRITAELEGLTTRLTEVERELEGLGQVGAGAGDELERLEALHEEAQRTLAISDEEASTARVARARAETRQQALLEALEQATRAESTMGGDLERIEHSRERAEAQLLESRAALAKAQAELETVDTDARLRADERATADASRERYETGREAAEAALKEIDEAIQAGRSALAEATLDHEKTLATLEGVDRQNRERYDLEPGDAIEEVGREAARDPLPDDHAKTLEQVRAKLRAFGDVNTAAVREFTEVQEREALLLAQKTDLEQAVADLREAIERIDETCRVRFVETFEKVNAQFSEVFPRLFNGGAARLVLTDPDNILETGVEIVAQPPGKRRQTLSLLSGGEKALTAVSLMMALFLLRPAPFCILDEVDAPLDDVNVARFARLLHDLAERSQLLVVTHNRLTMRAADRLYGVTMESKGVSKLVTVKLDVAA